MNWGKATFSLVAMTFAWNLGVNSGNPLFELAVLFGFAGLAYWSGRD